MINVFAPNRLTFIVMSPYRARKFRAVTAHGEACLDSDGVHPRRKNGSDPKVSLKSDSQGRELDEYITFRPYCPIFVPNASLFLHPEPVLL